MEKNEAWANLTWGGGNGGDVVGVPTWHTVLGIQIRIPMLIEKTYVFMSYIHGVVMF